METTDKTKEVEQEIDNPQNTATAPEADLKSEGIKTESAKEVITEIAEAEAPVESIQEEVEVTEAKTTSEEAAIANETTMEEVAAEETPVEGVQDEVEVAEAKTTSEETAIANETTMEEVVEAKATEEDAKPIAKEAKGTEEKEETPTTNQETSTPEKDQELDYASMSLEELVNALVDLVQHDDVASIKEGVGTIKSQYIKKIKQRKQDLFDKFIADGGIEEEYKTIKYDFEAQYQAAFALYKEKRTKYIQLLEQQKEENLKKKEALLESLRIMINSNENLNKIYHEFKDLQEQWRQIGQVPQNQVKTLWENYHFLVETFFDKVKINKELMMMGLNKNLEEKIHLCEKTEELLLEKSINKSFKLLQEYHERWKEVGPVPQEKNDEIWDRFKNATNKVNQRRHEYYENLHEEQKSNLLLKTALCEKAESILDETPKSISEWNKITEEVNALFAEWKTLGPAPKKFNDSIWKRFKTAVDSFFKAKKEFLGSIKEEQTNNYHLKLDLIAQVEALKDSTDWRNTTQEFVKIQRKWKEIGQVPRKYSDKIWKIFRGHCDDFFNAKEEFFKNIGQVEADNKEKKLQLIKEIEEYSFGENQEENLNAIKGFQRRWIEIGRVPIKDKSKLQNSFKKVIDKHLNDLNINSFDFENAGLKNKIDNMENKADAERLLRKEMNFYRTKIDYLKKDLILWENNISFFANSKNADLLKADFEKKINKGKKEVDLLKAKVRHFDKMIRNLKNREE